MCISKTVSYSKNLRILEKEGKIALAEKYFETLQGRQHENKFFIGPSFLDLFYRDRRRGGGGSGE